MLTIIVAVIGLIGVIALAYATYLAPAHAEERKFELQERARRIEQAQVQALENKPQVRLLTHPRHNALDR